MTVRDRFLARARGVFVPSSPVAEVAPADVAGLIDDLTISGVDRTRILLHGDPAASLHQMLIAHRRGTPIVPHINDSGAKAYHMVAGRMIVAFFDEQGHVTRSVEMSGPGAPGNLILRWNAPLFHTILLETETACFVETASGPHRTTRYADWVPADEADLAAWWSALHRQVGLAPAAPR